MNSKEKKERKCRQLLRCPLCGKVAYPRHIGAVGKYPLQLLEFISEGRGKFIWERKALPLEVAEVLLDAIRIAFKQVETYIDALKRFKEVKCQERIKVETRDIVPIPILQGLLTLPMSWGVKIPTMSMVPVQAKPLKVANVNLFFVKTQKQENLLLGRKVLVQRDMLNE